MSYTENTSFYIDFPPSYEVAYDDEETESSSDENL